MPNSFDKSGLNAIEKVLQSIPNSPGVYKMFGNKGILYIGKAKNLKLRVKSYLNLKEQSIKNQVMLESVEFVDYEVVNTEEEALILESSLIKQHQPPFNILLKDDKTKPYIVVSTSLKYPGIFKTRGHVIGGDKSFGPFMDRRILDNIIDAVARIFKIRTCSNIKFKAAKRPCLEYQVRRCTAPCVNYISYEQYHDDVRNALAFLSGRDDMVIKDLKLKMEQAARKEHFTLAANLRDQMFKLQNIISINKIVDFKKFDSVDAVLIDEIENKVAIEVFIVRNGLCYGSHVFFPKKTENESLKSIMEFFLMRYYSSNEVPSKVALNIGVSPAIQKVFKNHTWAPKSGIYKNLVDFAMPNLKEKLQKKVDAKININKILYELNMLLGIRHSLTRIEIYDNSHTSGSFMLGAMVVFDKEEGFKKEEYRKFNKKFSTTKDGDDYGMLREMLTRRFTNEKMKLIRPQLLIIDGGKGQFSACKQVLEDLNIKIPLLCMAKGKHRNAGKEWFYYKDKEFQLRLNSALLYFLQNLRDEAHRFAITSHRNRREKF